MTLCFKPYLANSWKFLPVDLKNIPYWMIKIPMFLLILCLYEGYQLRSHTLYAHRCIRRDSFSRSQENQIKSVKEGGKKLLKQCRPRTELYNNGAFTWNCAWCKSFFKFHLHNWLKRGLLSGKRSLINLVLLVLCQVGLAAVLWAFSYSPGTHLCGLA